MTVLVLINAGFWTFNHASQCLKLQSSYRSIKQSIARRKLGAFLPSASDCFLALRAPLFGLEIRVIIVSGVVMTVFESTGLESDWPLLPVCDSFPFVLAWTET